MPREEVSGSGGGKKRVQDDRHACLPTDAPEKDPSGSWRSGAEINPSAGDSEVANDPVDGPPVETANDDPDSTSDTILTPGSPSEYDRQRDARPNRDGDNWATDTTGR